MIMIYQPLLHPQGPWRPSRRPYAGGLGMLAGWPGSACWQARQLACQQVYQQARSIRMPAHPAQPPAPPARIRPPKGPAPPQPSASCRIGRVASAEAARQPPGRPPRLPARPPWALATWTRSLDWALPDQSLAWVARMRRKYLCVKYEFWNEKKNEIRKRNKDSVGLKLLFV